MYSDLYLRFNVALAEPGLVIDVVDADEYYQLTIELSEAENAETYFACANGIFEGNLDRWPTAGLVVEMSTSEPAAVPAKQRFRFE